LGQKLRIIKRTKITVIRTETVFLRMQNGESAKEILQIQTADLTENEKDSVLIIEAIKQIENTRDKKGELK